MNVTLSASDLRSVAQLSRFASTSDPDLQYVCALPAEQSLLWVATDQRCLATFSCGSWHGDASTFGMPLRELDLPLAQLYRTDGGAVLLEAHCTLEDLDEVKLRTRVELVADLTFSASPWMRDFFGAGSHSDGRDSE